MNRPDTITATLPLPEPETSPLRQAYEAARLPQLRIPFDAALRNPALRICLQCSAEAKARRKA